MNQYVKKAYEIEVNILEGLNSSLSLPDDNSDPTDGNIIQIIDHQLNHKQNGEELCILLEYCQAGSLFEFIETKCEQGLRGISDEVELLKIINDISNGL